jgi:hypothetical protein
MKKVISFSFYQAPKEWEVTMETNSKKYINGLKINLELCKKYYPDWVVYLYYSDNVDNNIIESLKEYDNLELKKVTDYSISAMQWRFLPHDDINVELFICRDLDSRITYREVVSVNEWINDGKILHVMRDHPHHNYFILGGMWGMRRQNDFNMSENIKNWNISKNYNKTTDWFDKWWDMKFLDDIIWPKFCYSIYENASYWCKTNFCKSFTEEMIDKHFIGEIFLENGERHYHYKLL